MPKIPDCDFCLLYAHNPHLICTVHPSGVDSDRCLDFRPDPDAEIEEKWSPIGSVALLPRNRSELISHSNSMIPPAMWSPVTAVVSSVDTYITIDHLFLVPKNLQRSVRHLSGSIPT